MLNLNNRVSNNKTFFPVFAHYLDVKCCLLLTINSNSCNDSYIIYGKQPFLLFQIYLARTRLVSGRCIIRIRLFCLNLRIRFLVYYSLRHLLKLFCANRNLSIRMRRLGSKPAQSNYFLNVYIFYFYKFFCKHFRKGLSWFLI